MGYTDLPNPCRGVKGNKEKGRDRYVSDAEYVAVWEAANPMLRNIMNLLLNTGQRPADILKMKRAEYSRQCNLDCPTKLVQS